MSAFVRRIDDFGLPQATERAFLDCQLDEDALHTTAVASAPGNTYVRPYLKGQKNDFRDAEAIAEAVQRPTMKFVATKTAEQLDRPPPRREQWARQGCRGELDIETRN
jgi:site-specific DNA-cytosine methylase